MQVGGGGGNRTLSRPFREIAVARDFRGKLVEQQAVRFQLVVPVSPLESPTVLPSLGEIVESCGNGVPPPIASLEKFRWGRELEPVVLIQCIPAEPGRRSSLRGSNPARVHSETVAVDGCSVVTNTLSPSCQACRGALLLAWEPWAGTVPRCKARPFSLIQ